MCFLGCGEVVHRGEVSRVTFLPSFHSFFPFFFFACLIYLFDVLVTHFCLGTGLSLVEDCPKASLVTA